MAKNSNGGGSDKMMTWRIAKTAIALIGATVVGTWATRRTAWSPLWKGMARAGGAMVVAYLVRKKAPTVAMGVGTYALATLAMGAVEQYDMSRYLAMTDAQRAALGTGTNAGAAPTGALPPARGDNGYGTGLEGLEAYRAQGYATL